MSTTEPDVNLSLEERHKKMAENAPKYTPNRSNWDAENHRFKPFSLYDWSQYETYATTANTL